MNKEIYILEFNFKQCLFHRTILQEAIKDNHEQFLKFLKSKEDPQNNWLPIAMGTWEEMALLGEQLQKQVREEV